MSKHQKIALLRGINVGGKNKLKMDALRASLLDAGLEDVRTYIQSGNIAFGSAASRTKLQKLIHDTIEQQFGYDLPVLVREQEYFNGIIEQNPFLGSGKKRVDIKQLCVTLLQKKPSAKAVRKLGTLKFDDKYRIVDDAVYLRLTKGYADTKLTNGFLEKKLGVAATSRNWKTICKLVEM